MARRDRREEILQRLLVVLGRVPGIAPANVVRNRGQIPEKLNVPWVVLLDGREVGDATVTGRGRRTPLPAIVELIPQIFVILPPRDNPANEGVGEEMSTFRMRVVQVLSSDSILLNILGAEGEIIYRGFDTDMETGGNLEGQMQFHFALRYPLIPSEVRGD